MSTAVDARPIDKLVFFGWWSVMALLPLGHLTGLRNTWTVLVVIGTLVWLGRDAWRGLAARVPLALLLLWCAASIAWSTTPAISFGKWQTDLLIPLLAYAAAFGYVRRTGSLVPVVGGLMTGMGVLMLISLTAVLPTSLMTAVSTFVSMEDFPNIAGPMPIWYPGVGDASMAASLSAAILVCAPRLMPRVAGAWWWAGWAALIAIVVASNNRNAALAIPIVALLAWLWMRRLSKKTVGPWSRTRWGVSILGAALLSVSLIAALETSARERLRIIGEPVAADRSGLVVLTERDTRPMIWAYYAKLAIRSPIIGVGFGRTVPGIHYRTQDDRALARIEFNAYIHAHNLFLNWWLQTGVIGVALLIAVLVAIVTRASRCRRRTSDPRAVAAWVAICALLVAMLIRDATDDLLVYGMATLFWVLIGCVAGLVERYAMNDALTAPRFP